MSRTHRETARTKENRRYQVSKKNPEDTGKTVAYATLLGAVGYGIYILMTKESVTEENFDIVSVTINEKTTTNKVTNTDFDYITPEVLTITDKLNINIIVSWISEKTQTVTVQARAGHKGILPMDFVEKTPYYNGSIQLGIETSMQEPIVIPLVNCGGLDDGAIEIKVGTYISQVWNVFDTSASEPSEWDIVAEVVNMILLRMGGVVDLWFIVTEVINMKLLRMEDVIDLWFIVAEKRNMILERTPDVVDMWFIVDGVTNMTIKVAQPTSVDFSVEGDGFLLLTSYWQAYYYETDGDIIDLGQYGPGDTIYLFNVKPIGMLSCYMYHLTVNGWEWSRQYFSKEVLFWDRWHYRYDIVANEIYIENPWD